MDQERFPLYGPIHKALRSVMAGLIARSGAADWSDPKDVAAIQAEWENAMTLVASHHHHEDDFIHPLLAKASPGAHREIEREHEEQSRAREDLAGFLQQIASSDASGPQKQRLGAEFTVALYTYYSGLLMHMRREEGDAQSLLDRHYSFEELAAVNNQIVRSVPPDEMMLALGCMFPSISIYEQAGILGGIKADAPPHVFQAVSERVRAAIGEDAWARLAQRIGA